MSRSTVPLARRIYAQGRTIEEVADAMKVSKSNLGQVIVGKVHMGAGLRAKLAAALGCTVDQVEEDYLRARVKTLADCSRAAKQMLNALLKQKRSK